MTTTRKVFFRIDQRDFKPGALMPPPAKDYISTLSQGHKAVEGLLRQYLPNGTVVRGSTLHVFEDQNVAYNYFLPSSIKGRHLYEVEVDISDIRYCGDMALYNQAAELLNNPSEMDRLAQDYCSGKRSAHPMIEVMVNKATVKKRIHTAAEGTDLFRKRHFPSSAVPSRKT